MTCSMTCFDHATEKGIDVIKMIGFSMMFLSVFRRDGLLLGLPQLFSMGMMEDDHDEAVLLMLGCPNGVSCLAKFGSSWRQFWAKGLLAIGQP